MVRYTITRHGEADIEELLLYIAADNLDAALRINDRLTEVFEMLCDFPDSGRKRNELQNGIRSFPVESYLVFYRSWANNIAIVRVIHGARDIDEIFG